jgi:hypothetical protein
MIPLADCSLDLALVAVYTNERVINLISIGDYPRLCAKSSANATLTSPADRRRISNANFFVMPARTSSDKQSSRNHRGEGNNKEPGRQRNPSFSHVSPRLWIIPPLMCACEQQVSTEVKQLISGR